MRIDSPEIVGEITLPATSSGHFSGSFEGDGSNLTGIVATVLDIDAFGDDLTGATLAGTDKMILSDGGTEGRVTVSQLSTPLAGTGLEANAGTVRIAAAAAGAGLTGGAGSALAVGAGTGITVNADDIQISDGGVTATQLATSVAGDGLAGGGGTALSVNVDDSTIETNADTLRVKDSGITNAKLANSSVAIGDQTITLGAAATTELTGLTNISADTGSFVLQLFESSSTIITSGSNIFGDKANDTQRITGSVLLTGSFIATAPGATINGAAIVTGSPQINHDATLNFVANEHIDHTSVTLTAGDGLTGGGDISADRSFAVNVDDSSIEINADTLRVKASGVTNAMLNGSIANDKLTNSSITINGTSVSLGGTLTAAQTLDGSISGSVQVNHDSTTGFVANEHIDHSGVTLTAGDGLTGGGTIAASRTFAVGAGTAIDVTADAVNVDLSELSTSTTNGDGDYFVVVDTANAQRKLTKANIAISGFNNDSGFTTNTGTVTSVTVTAGSGLTGGGTVTTSGTATLNIGAGTGIDVAADAISVDVSDFMTNGSNNRVITATGTDAMNAEANLTFDGTDLGVLAGAVSASGTGRFSSLGINTAPSGVAGAILATNDVVAFASSDERLKTNLEPIGSAVEKVEQLTGYTFNWIPMEDVHVYGDIKDIGVVAQEVEKVLPEIVSDRENGYKAVKYEKLTAVLIQAVKELSERVKILENK